MSESEWVDSENNKIKNDLNIVCGTTSGFDANNKRIYILYVREKKIIKPLNHDTSMGKLVWVLLSSDTIATPRNPVSSTRQVTDI